MTGRTNKWSADDMGAAMAAYVERHAQHAKRHKSRGTLEAEAFHRGGDNAASLVVWEHKGTWADARAGAGGGFVDFARDVAHMAPAELMRAYGPAAATSGTGAPRKAQAAHQATEAPRRQATEQAAAQANMASEAAAFWARCVPVLDDAETTAWLASRGLDAGDVEARDLARVVPVGAPCPSWAAYGARTWAELGLRLVVPMLDARGALASLHARDVTGKADKKTLHPTGGKASGHVMADGLGQLMLQGEALELVARCGLWLAEGVPDFLTLATYWSDANEDAPAVLGVVSGAWCDKVAARIPDGTRVVVATDADDAGEKYAADIQATLAARVRLERYKHGTRR